MATKYAITGGGNWSGAIWNTASNQSTSNTTAPTTSDTAILDQYSGNVVINTTTCVAGVLNCTGYTGTLSGSSPNQLWVYGSWTLSAGMTLSGNFIFKCGNSSTTGTWTPNGQTFPGNFIANGTGAKTLTAGDNYTVTGLHTWLQTCNLTGSGSTIYVNGGWTGTSYFNDAATNPVVYIQGGTLTNTIPNTPNGCHLRPNVSQIIIAPASGTTYNAQMRETTHLIIDSGTYGITTTDSEVYAVTWSGQYTDNTGSFSFYRLRWASGTCTLNTDMYVTKLNNVSSTWIANGAHTIHVDTFCNAYGNCNWGGTATLSIEGTISNFLTPAGLVSGTLNGTVKIGINLTFNAPDKTITFYPKTYTFDETCIIKKTAGTIVTTGVTTQINGNVSFDWYNGTFPTVTFMSNTNVLKILDDFTITTLNMHTGSTMSGADTKTLTISSAWNACANETYRNTIDAISGTFKMNYQGTLANCQIAKTDFTDIDASASAIPIYNWYGSASSCTNITAVTGEDIGGGGGAGITVTNI